MNRMQARLGFVQTGQNMNRSASDCGAAARLGTDTKFGGFGGVEKG